MKVFQIVPMPAHHFPMGSSLTTLHLCSDGINLYWVWSPVSLNEKTQKGHSVFMDVFQLTVRPFKAFLHYFTWIYFLACSSIRVTFSHNFVFLTWEHII